MKNLHNQVVYGFIALIAVFFFLISMFPTAQLIIVLNGIIFGCFAAIANAYWKLWLMAITGDGRKYDQIRQMTISIILQWIVIFGSVWTSFKLRSMGIEITASHETVLIRLLAILAAVLQVTAPDFGLGIFYGRDRKVLWTGIVAGTVFAVFVIYLQVFQVLEKVNEWFGSILG